MPKEKSITTRLGTRVEIEVTTVEARQAFSDTVNHAVYGGKWVTLTRRGRPLARIIPVGDFEALRKLTGPN
ncbi:MAG: type II toxin-antitoxin system Phd/YefM family antitoxin [Alphaproteobacteria bacterium]|nr:type II toxin-antitoxin system Phd/YefM family antitoxin [Alphaproteobacteria bacterium]